MGKPIEKGIFTDGWVVNSKRVGPNAFVALVSHERRGTSPIVVIRKGVGDLAQLLSNSQEQLGCWTALSGESAYRFAEESPVVVYGGEGPFALTPNRILTASSYQEVVDVNNALGKMMNRAVRFARAITEAT